MSFIFIKHQHLAHSPAQNLYPFRVLIDPPLPFPADYIPTTVVHEGCPYAFSSFVILSHAPLPTPLPSSVVHRDGKDYVVSLQAYPLPERWGGDLSAQLKAIDWCAQTE